MKTIKIEMTRTDNIKVELDPEYFNEEWFKAFNKYFYNYETLEGIAEYISYNIVHNRSNFIEGVGIPMFDGKKPWVREGEEINEHVNVIYNQYDTEVEYETEEDK